MLFNSLAFAVFFPSVLIVYWLLRTPRRQNLFVLAASLFFYGWWDWRFLSLLLASAVVDYGCALAIGRAQEQGQTGKGWLQLSLAFNLSMLGVFKYFDFFVRSAEPIWNALGWSPSLLGVVLPVGISFYTFQTMSYTIDVYRGRFEARRSFVDVAAYVTFFPQLVAGPIERASSLIPQLEQPRTLTAEKARLGLMLMVTGFFKKLVLADGISPMADAIYQRAARGEVIDPAEMLLGTYAFSLQLYGDFSGYSDIARGAACLLGFNLIVNFKQPYFSRTFGEVWRRWHISLSLWLRDYLYISLGGSRGGKLLTLRNLFLTMFLGGLWHGADWHYIAWGSLVGLLLLIEQLLPLKKPETWRRPLQLLGLLVTYHLWILTLVFFRADSVATAVRLLGSAARGVWHWPAWEQCLAVCLGTVLLILIDLPHLLYPKEELPCAERRGWLVTTLALAVLGFYLVPPVGSVQFIYFQF